MDKRGAAEVFDVAAVNLAMDQNVAMEVKCGTSLVMMTARSHRDQRITHTWGYYVGPSAMRTFMDRL